MASPNGSRHRLSIYNIPDALARGRFVREIRDAKDDWVRWEVLEEEAYRADLISFRYYGTEEAASIIYSAAFIDNPELPIQIGSQIPLPPVAWIRQRIRYHQDN